MTLSWPEIQRTYARREGIHGKEVKPYLLPHWIQVNDYMASRDFGRLKKTFLKKATTLHSMSMRLDICQFHIWINLCWVIISALWLKGIQGKCLPPVNSECLYMRTENKSLYRRTAKPMPKHVDKKEKKSSKAWSKGGVSGNQRPIKWGASQ